MRRISSGASTTSAALSCICPSVSADMGRPSAAGSSKPIGIGLKGLGGRARVEQSKFFKIECDRAIFSQPTSSYQVSNFTPPSEGKCADTTRFDVALFSPGNGTKPAAQPAQPSPHAPQKTQSNSTSPLSRGHSIDLLVSKSWHSTLLLRAHHTLHCGKSQRTAGQ